MPKTMKTLLTICLALTVSSAAYSQSSKCGVPISDYEFQKIKRDISIQATPYEKLMRAKRLVKANCYTQDQIKHILNFFAEDHERLEIAMEAYPNIYHKHDIYGLYDSFAYFSTAFRFRDFVEKQQAKSSSKPSTPKLPEITFKNLYYPNADGYKGPTQCDRPVSDDEFIKLAIRMQGMADSRGKYMTASQFVLKHCMSVEQVMKAATLLATDQYRQQYLQAAHGHIYDIRNYRSAASVFEHADQGKKFLAYLYSKRQSTGPNQNRPPTCEVSETKMRGLTVKLMAEAFDDDRLNLAKREIPPSKCYTSKQMARIVATFRFDDEKLEIAKYGYQYVKDPEAYYNAVSTTFNFPSDKRALSNYISANKR